MAQRYSFMYPDMIGIVRGSMSLSGPKPYQNQLKLRDVKMVTGCTRGSERMPYMYSEALGIGSGSSSLAGDNGNIDKLRLYVFSQRSGAGTGQHLTFGVLKSYNTSWGEEQQPLYTDVLEGYTYVWHMDAGVFIVTSSTGEATVHTNINSLKDLRVSWGVLKQIWVGGSSVDLSNMNIFAIATRPDQQKVCYRVVAGSRMHNDYLLDNQQHIAFNRLAEHSQFLNSFDTLDRLPPSYAYLPNSIVKNILVPYIGELQATNGYHVESITGQVSTQADRILPNRRGTVADIGRCLMIALFAQNLLSSDSDIVYEPWMLYATFQWYFNTVHRSTNPRQIFDLSPRW